MIVVCVVVESVGQGRLPRKVLRQSRVLGTAQVRLYRRTLRSTRGNAHCGSIQQPDHGSIASPYCWVTPIVCLSVDIVLQNIQLDKGEVTAAQRVGLAV